MKRFSKNYVNPKSVISFSGISNLTRSTKIPKKKLQRELAKQNTYVVHREAKRPSIYNPFILYERRILMQSDLVDMSSLSPWNGGIKWILIVVDAFSRKCWVRILPNKTSVLVLQKFREIFEETGPFKRLMTDAGSEFIAEKFKNFMKKNKISFTRGNPHAPHVERLNRTLQSRIYKYMTENETKNWIQAIEAIVQSYNSRRHSTIKMEPNRADLPKHRNKVIENLTLYYDRSLQKRKKPKFKIGDTVSIQKLRGVFAKGYEKVFTEELFKIKKVHTKLPIPQYTLTDYTGEEELSGRFYENEMQLATYDVFKVEKELNERFNSETGEEEVLVKWLGWPEKYNEWISKTKITRDYEKDNAK